MKIDRLTKETFGSIQDSLLKRSANSYPKQEAAVAEILENVKNNGDKAVFEYEKKFDHCELSADNIRVTPEEEEEAYKLVDPELVGVIRRAIRRIRAFHEHERQESWFMTEKDGMVLGQRITPLQRAGVYVPGGKAAYPSSVLMNVIPAKVAGVDEIVMCTPPGADGKVYPTTLVAAKEAGVDTIFKVGGAQAIAAMAYGTESIRKVDKITGPGNIYVALAKRAVYGHVSIDSVAGPSEVTVLADDTADAHCIAADLLSQAEHDELACAILVTTSAKLAEDVNREIDGYLTFLSRADIIRKSLDNFGHILLVDDLDDLVMTKVRNAGAMFIGPNSSEPLGDYFAGPNHVLPTNGTAKFFSALSVDDFVKKSSIIYSSGEALRNMHSDIIRFAKAEKLTAHANAIQVRFGEEEGNQRSE